MTLHTAVIAVVQVLMLTSVPQVRCALFKAELPHELQNCYNVFGNVSLADVVGETVCWACESSDIGRLMDYTPAPETPSSTAYVRRLIGNLNEAFHYGRFLPRTRTPCVRKEYRMLTDLERTRFHDAVNALKLDTSAIPNKYDVIARLHRGLTLNAAHGGPAFLGWHRAYILVFEWELQSVDPSVCLPYWDSSLDSRLPNPALSNVFSSEFLGGRGYRGPVRDGPFANWIVPEFGRLNREIGATGDLYSEDELINILSQTRTFQISLPNTQFQNHIEFHHNGVHNFIGGQMSRLSSAAHDPAFFLHHSFVDYLWEVFRDRQRRLGIDPQFDYPVDFGRLSHDPDAPLGFDRYGIAITNRQSYYNNLTETYMYEPSPTCSLSRPTCSSRYLRCDRLIYRCIPVDPFLNRAGLAGLSTSLRRPPMSIQNSFCIDGVCDMNEWVYIPVEVVSMRSPGFKYDSYPVHNNSLWTDYDIYAPMAYAETKQFMPKRAPKGYEKCYDYEGVGQVYIQSTGLNYNGRYKESVIIDQRLPTSMSIGYVAVKNPRNTRVKALFRGFDFCGRICKTAFKVPGTNRFEPFSGVLDIEDIPGLPRQYTYSYGQATLDTWDYTANPDCPSFMEKGIVLRFYCDYDLRFPWLGDANGHHPGVALPTRPIAVPPPLSLHKPKTVLPPWKLQECRIDRECMIDAPCKADPHCLGERYACRWPSNNYVDCFFGKYWKI